MVLKPPSQFEKLIYFGRQTPLLLTSIRIKYSIIENLEIFLIVAGGRPPIDVVADETAGRLPSVGHVVDSWGSHSGYVVTLSRSVMKRVNIDI